MDLETSAYQGFKLWLAGYIPLDLNTLHYLIGAGLLLGAMVHVRKRPRMLPLVLALVVAIALGVGMELADMRDDLAALGYWRWRASLLDLGRTIAFPLVGVLLARWLFKWPSNAQGR